MRLHNKMLLLMGGSSFLISAVVLVLSLWYMTFASSKIKEEGNNYASYLLQKKSKENMELLRDSTGAIFSRISSDMLTPGIPRSLVVNVIRKRFEFAYWADRAFFVDFVPQKNGTSEKISLNDFKNLYFITETPSGNKESSDPKELPILAAKKFQNLISAPDIKSSTRFMLNNQDLWIVHIEPYEENRMIYAVRISKNFLSGAKIGNLQAKYILLSGETVLSTNICNPETGSPETTLPKDIARCLSEMVQNISSLPSSHVLSKTHTDSKNEKTWYLVGMRMDFSFFSAKKICLIRLYEYDQNIPRFSKFINEEIDFLYSSLPLLAILGLLGMLIPMVFFSQRLSRPLQDAAEYADLLAAGQFCKSKTKPVGIREIDDLQKSLNLLGDRMNIMISKLRQSNDREIDARLGAESVNRLQSDFLKFLSFQMRGPMSSIAGFLDYFQKKTNNNEQISKEYVPTVINTMNDDYRKLFRILRKLEDVSSVAIADSNTEIVPVDVYAVLQKVADGIHQETAGNETLVEIQFGNELPKQMTTDPEKLLHVLELVYQAFISATPSGAALRFGNYSNADSICFHVSGDSEIQVQYEYELYLSNKIGFDDLHFPNAVTDLILAKYIGKLLDMQMVLQTKPDGFRMELIFPIQNPKAVRKKTNLSSQNISDASFAATETPHITDIMATIRKAKSLSFGKPIRVLSVSDDGSDKLLLELILLDSKASVCSAADADTALNRVKDGEYDAAIIDLRLKDSDLFALLRQIREISVNRGIRIIVITSGLKTDDKEAILGSGADQCIVKPISSDEITTAVFRAAIR